MRPGEGVPHGSTPPATGRCDADETSPPPRPPLPAKPLVVYQRNKWRRKTPNISEEAIRRRDVDDTPPSLQARLPVVYQRKRQRRRQKKKKKTEERHIPEDNLIEILSRLPYRSLCRFKCVSKRWLALCSDPAIRERSTQTLTGFFHKYQCSDQNLRFHNLNGTGPPMVDPDLPFLMRGGYTRFRVMHYSSGLLLCKCSKKSGPQQDEKMDLIVCNPATEECYVLPPIYVLPKQEEEEEEDEDEDEYEEKEEEEEEGEDELDEKVEEEEDEQQERDELEEEGEEELEEGEEDEDGLDEKAEEDKDEEVDRTPFIPREAYLGFDAAFPSSFVVFVLVEGRLDDVVIYSSKTKKWTQTWCEDYGDDDLVTPECVFHNGFMHMVVDEYNMVALDTKFSHRIPLPTGLESGIASTSMGLSQGLLHFWYIDPEEYQLSVWVLKKYDGKKWALKHTVEILELFYPIRHIMTCEVFAIHPEKNWIYITDGENTTISYNMDNGEKSVMCNSGEFLGGSPFVPFFGKWLS